MSTQNDMRASQEMPSEAVPRFGHLTPWVVTVGLIIFSVVSWWLLADPQWSPVGASLPAIDALLFWTILGFIFTGFTFANWPFSKISQPLAGVLHVGVDVAIGFVAVWLFSFVLGSWDPTFSHSAPGGAGFTATAFVVLIGFYAYALAAATWGGYPFEEVPAPLASVAQFFLAAFITVIGVVVLVYPNFSAALAKNAPLALAPATGWVYSSIVVVIVAAMLWENWPWASVTNRHLRAAAALVITLGGGAGLYFLFRLVVQAVTPASIKVLPAFSVALQTAELGVCFSLWALVMGLIFGPSRLKLGTAATRIARTAILAVAAIATYVIFMRFFATKVLHFTPLSGDYGGDPLTWMDWTILVVLWYAVAFGKYGSTKSR
ncbi:MAG: amino acid transporter, family [Gemmatimonadales bacterium]|jgi:AAT family amino acid transporter|nr:amino acid transporter, family [Trebonia sp.]MEA2714311.1 amino acid transporter, family [Gemmatimonadales bacterium]